MDNERQALPQESEPLGVGIVDRALSPNNNQMYSHSDLEPLSDIVDSGVPPNIIEPSQSDIAVINELHTHLGRPPG